MDIKDLAKELRVSERDAEALLVACGIDAADVNPEMLKELKELAAGAITPQSGAITPTEQKSTITKAPQKKGKAVAKAKIVAPQAQEFSRDAAIQQLESAFRQGAEFGSLAAQAFRQGRDAAIGAGIASVMDSPIDLGLSGDIGSDWTMPEWE